MRRILAARERIVGALFCAADPHRISRIAMFFWIITICSASAMANSPPSQKADQAALRAMLRGEDPGAYIAELKSQRPIPKQSFGIAQRGASSPGAALKSLALSLRTDASKSVDAEQTKALMRRALGEVLLLRTEFEALGVSLSKSAFAAALSRWQAADQLQGKRLRAIESALQQGASAVKAHDQSSAIEALRPLLGEIDTDAAPRVLGTRDLPVAPPEFSPRPLPTLGSALPSFADSTAAPGGPADRTPSHDTELTETILAKAQSLNHEPVHIHDFVRSQIRTEWYAGAQKGATETLRSGAGNDADQASLLIALLRASSMPARYVKGVVELKLPQLRPMLGLTSAADIGRALTAAGIANEPVIRSGGIDAFRIEHIFVSAYVPYGNYRGTHVDSGGAAWIPLAPAIKDYEFIASGDVLTRAGINAEEFINEWLAASASSLPLDALRLRAQAWLATQSGAPLLDAQLQRRVVSARPLGLLPSSLPCVLIGTVYESAELAETDQQWLRIQLLSGNEPGSTVALDHRIRVSDLIGRRLTLSYQPATEDDHNIINSFGSLPLTPAYLIRMRARLLMRGEPETLSSVDWTPGTAHRLELITETPAGNIRTRQSLIAGSYTAITVGAQASATPVSALDVPHPNDSEFVAAQRLASLGLRYVSTWDTAENQLADLIGVLPLRPAPSIALTLVEYHVETLLDLPTRLVIKGVSLDAAQRPTQAIASTAQRAREAEFLRYSSLHGSALEHWIFENDWGVASISADKGLQLAAQNGIARIIQTGGTLPASVLLPASVRSEIETQLARGWRVEVVASELALNLWSGAVWRAEDPATGASGWFIAGRYAGGATTENPADWPSPFPDPNAPAPNQNPNAARYVVMVTSTDKQDGTVDEELDKELSVRVLDSGYRPVIGATVRFHAISGDPLLAGTQGQFGNTADVLTDANGIARAKAKPGRVIRNAQLRYVDANDPEEELTATGINQVSAKAMSSGGSPGAPEQALATMPEGFVFYGLPGEIAELGPSSDPPGLTLMAQAGMFSWRVTAKDQFGNIVSNDPIEFSTVSSTMGPNGECPGPQTSSTPMWVDAGTCLLSPLNECPGAQAQKTMRSGYPNTRVDVRAPMLGGFRHTLRAASGAAEAFRYFTSDCPGYGTVLMRYKVDQLGRVIEAVLSGQTLDYRRLFRAIKYNHISGVFENWTPIPEFVAFGVEGHQGSVLPPTPEGSDGSYSVGYSGAPSPSYTPLSIAWERFNTGNGFLHGMRVDGFHTINFRIQGDELPRIELDDRGYPLEEIRIPIVWESVDPSPWQRYPISPTAVFRKNGNVVHVWKIDDRAPFSAVSGGADVIVPPLFRLDRSDPEDEFTVEVVLHYGSVAQLRSERVDLEFGQPMLKRYGMSGGKNGSDSGSFPRRLRIKQTLDRAADLVCYDPVSFEFELYRAATVEVLAYPIRQDGTEGSPIALIESAEFDEGTHSKTLQPFDIPWGDYRLQITATDPETDEEEPHEASLSNEVDMLDALPLSRSIVQNVDLHDGNLGIARADIDLGGRGPGLKFTRFYSSPRPARGDAGALGYGWHSNIESGIEVAGGCGGFMVTGADGGAQRFLHAVSSNGGDTTYKPLHGYHGTLIKRASGMFDYFSIDGTRYHFEPVSAAEGAQTGQLARLVLIQDSDGNAVEYIYGSLDGGGHQQVVELRDSAGRVLRFDYEPSPELMKFTNGDGEEESFPMRGRMVLTRVTVTGGLVVHYTYNSDGMLVSANRDGNACAPGHCERYRYVDLGRSAYLLPNAQFPTTVHHGPALSGIEQIGNASARYQYEPLTLDQNIVDGGQTYLLQIPTRGIDSLVTFDSSVWQFGYQPPNRGLVPANTVVQDGRGLSTTHSLNRYGAAETVTDAIGMTRTVWNFTHYKPASVTDAMNRATNYTYDEHGNKTEESIQGGVIRSWSYYAPETFTIPIKNRASTYTDARGIVETYVYDGRGHLLSRTRAGKSESFGYDGRGDRVTHTDFNAGVWGFGFDAYGFPSTRTDPKSNGWLSFYDARGRLQSERDANGNTTTYDYDASDRQVYRGFAGGTSRVTRYEEGGRKQTVTDENGQPTVNRFDGLGRLTEVRNALIATRTLEYDGNGNLTDETDFRGNPTVYTYDAGNRLQTKTEPLGKTTVFTHDDLGHVLSESISGPGSATRVTHYEYNHPLYFRTRVTQSGGQGGPRGQLIHPDNAGNPLTTSDSLGRETVREFDAFDRPTSIQEPGRVTAITYDGNGNKLTESVGGRTRTWVYDSANRNVHYTDGAGYGSSTAYHPNGEVASRTDARSGVTTYTLDGRNRVTRMSGPRADQQVLYEYDGVGNRKREALSGGRDVHHTYDDLHRLKTSTDQIGLFLTRGYDADGNVTAEIDARSNTTTYTVNALNQREQAQQPLGRTLNWTYSVHGDVLTETNARGFVTTHTVDALGQRMQTALPSGAGAVTPRAWTYDAVGNVLTQTDSNGVVTTFGYDDLNRKTSASVTANDGGSAEVWTYDARNNPLTHTDRGGVQTVMTYDGEDRMETRTRASSSREVNTYDGNGNLKTQRDANGHLSTFEYDAANQRKSITRGGDIESWTYTPSNQIQTHTDRASDVTTFTYDVRDHVKTEKNAANETRIYTYDGNGNRLTIQLPELQTWTQTFDAANRLEKVVSPLGKTTLYDYHPDDQLARIEDANGHTVTLESDPLGRISARHYPGGASFRTVFDGEGNAKTETHPDTSITRTFDGLNRPRTLSYVGAALAAMLSISYDASSNPTDSSLTQAGRALTVQRHFDAQNRLERETSSVGATSVAIPQGYSHTQHFALDGNGNRRTTTDAGNKTSTQTFDAYNRIESTATPGEGSTTNTWNKDGTLRSVTHANGTQSNYQYDRAKRVTGISHSHDSAVTLSFAYTYDKNGNRKTETRTQSAIAGQAGSITTTTYDYDQDDRLTGTNVSHQPPSATTPDERTVWTLDHVGNRLTEVVTCRSGSIVRCPGADTVTSSKTYTYSARDQLETMTNPVNQLTVAYDYDQNGNRTRRTVTKQGQPPQTTTYTFDARDRMIKAEPNAPNTANAATVDYTYDADGRRIESIETPANVGATSVAKLSLYTGQTLIHEADPSNANGGLRLTDTYRHSAHLDRHLAIAQNGSITLRHYQLDALATPVAMTDSNGNTINRTAYSAWGEIEEQVANGIAQAPWQMPSYAPDNTGQAALLSNDGQSIGFTGYIRDEATGLYYAGARFYDPLVGGFNGMDPWAGDNGAPITLNKYLYANANPIRFKDPDGRQSIEVNVTSCSEDGSCGSVAMAGSALPFLSPSQMGSVEQADALIEAQARAGLFNSGRSDGPMVAQPLLATGAGQFERPYVEGGSSRNLSAMQSSAELDRALGFDPNYVGYGHGTEVAGTAAFHSLPPVAVASGLHTMATAKDGYEFTAGALEATLGALPIGLAGREAYVMWRSERAAARAMQQGKPVIAMENSAAVTTPVIGPAPGSSTAMTGPVRLKPPPGATPDELAQVRRYCDGCNQALAQGELSPTGRVSTKGPLREKASRAADRERARAETAGQPYQGHAGHVPDTTWTGNPVPPGWADLSPRVNTSLGGQTGRYPVGYKPTIFEVIDDLENLR